MKYLLILNRAKATPAMFSCEEEALRCAKRSKANSYKIVEQDDVSSYLEDKYGDGVSIVYEPVDGVWYFQIAEPHGTLVCQWDCDDSWDCDWCSFGGKFCEDCTEFGKNPHEVCGKVVDWNDFLEWLKRR